MEKQRPPSLHLGNVFLVFIIVFLAGITVFQYLKYNRLLEEKAVLERKINIQQKAIFSFQEELQELRSRVKIARNLTDRLLDARDQIDNRPDNISGAGGPTRMNSFITDTSSKDATEWVLHLSRRFNETTNDLDELIQQANKSYRDFSKLKAYYSTIPSLSPCSGWVSSGFGYRRDPISGEYRMHYGIDICNVEPVPIRATADGLVVFSGPWGGFGNLVTIDHGYGFQTKYAHLENIKVSANCHVQRGEIIGYMGRSGRTTGRHLHYEVLYEGRNIDPARFLLE